MYLATCGNLSVEINKSLEHIFESAKAANQEVILSFDNDIAGRKMTQELERLLQEKQCTYRVALPALGKDWNEVLYLQGRDHAVQEFLAQDKLYGFPQTSYNTSLLHKAGITQADCAGIHIKAEERSVVFGLHQNMISDQRLCSTVTYQWDQSGTERQYFQAGLPRGLAIYYRYEQPFGGHAAFMHLWSYHTKYSPGVVSNFSTGPVQAAIDLFDEFG